MAAGKKTTLIAGASILICFLIFVSGFVAGLYYQKNSFYNPDQGVACTLEAQICPDGSAIGRQPPDCEFPDCSDPIVGCTEEAKICPDGSAVGREGPNCEFPDCPDQPIDTKNEE